jgi:hypothetical protein
MPPILATDRLILRAHTAADFAGCCALWVDPEVTRFIGGRPSTPEEVWSRILRYVGHWQLLGYGYFVATDRQTGAVMGEFGLADFHRDITPALGDTPRGRLGPAAPASRPGHRPRSLVGRSCLGRPIHATHRLPDRSGEHPLTQAGTKARLHRIRPLDLQGPRVHPAGAACWLEQRCSPPTIRHPRA